MNSFKFHQAYLKLLCACLLMAIATSPALFAQLDEQGPKPTPMALPADNVEITDIQGRTITVTILATDNNGIRIRTAAGQETQVMWGRLNRESHEKIRGYFGNTFQLPLTTVIYTKADEDKGSIRTISSFNEKSVIFILPNGNYQVWGRDRLSQKTLSMIMGETEPPNIHEWKREQAEKQAELRRERAAKKAEEEAERIAKEERDRIINTYIFVKQAGKADIPHYGTAMPREKMVILQTSPGRSRRFSWADLCDESVAMLKREGDDSHISRKRAEYEDCQRKQREARLRKIAEEEEKRKSLAPVRLDGRIATGKDTLPQAVLKAVAAGNNLQNKGYKHGGGREQLEDTGYDCSGAVSYVLIKAGLLNSMRTSGQFMNYGNRGRGKWITIYAKPGHVFMTVGGLRLDTGDTHIHLRPRGLGRGPRWKDYPRLIDGYVQRHPPGF